MFKIFTIVLNEYEVDWPTRSFKPFLEEVSTLSNMAYKLLTHSTTLQNKITLYTPYKYWVSNNS